MRNIWIFLTRYNAFFLFVVFFIAGILLTIRNNEYNRNVTLNSTNNLVGLAYTRLNIINNYLNLGKANDSLVKENANLRNIITGIITADSAHTLTAADTTGKLQFTYLPCKVIKNSFTLRNNFITINKGSTAGITKGMGVISPDKGVVGIVSDVSDNFALVRSLLNKDTRISIALKKSMSLGSLSWGDRNYDITTAYINDIPNQVKINRGDTVITSGEGVFPPGIQVGKVSQTGVTTGDNFLGARITLFNDFSNLQYVYVIKNKLAAEQQALELKANER